MVDALLSAPSSLLPELSKPDLLRPLEKSVPTGLEACQLTPPAFSSFQASGVPFFPSPISVSTPKLFLSCPSATPAVEISTQPPAPVISSEPSPTTEPPLPEPHQDHFLTYKAPDGRRYLVALDDAQTTTGFAVLRGFNISGRAKDTGLPCDSPCAQNLRPLFQKMAKDGYNFMRLPIVWENIEKNPGEIDLAMAKELRDVVDEAGKYGIQVLIDFHQDLLGRVFRREDKPDWHGDGFPKWFLALLWHTAKGDARFDDPSWFGFGDTPWGANYPSNEQLKICMKALGHPEVQKYIVDFFTRMGLVFKDCKNIFGYDVLNEPFSKALNGDDYKRYVDSAKKGLGVAEALDEAQKAQFKLDSIFKSVLRTLKGQPSGQVTPLACVEGGGDWALSSKLIPQLATNTKDGHTTLTGPMDGTYCDTGHLYDPHAMINIPTDPITAPIPDLTLPDFLPSDSVFSKTNSGLLGVDGLKLGIREFLPPQPELYDAVAQRAVDLSKEWDMVYIVGEWGTPNSVQGFSRDYLDNVWLDAFESRMIPWLHWQADPSRSCDAPDDVWMQENFSKICKDEETGELNYELLGYNDLLRPYFQTTSGYLKNYKHERDRKNKALWRMSVTVDEAMDEDWVSKLIIPEALGDCLVTLNGVPHPITGSNRTLLFTTNEGPVDVVIEPAAGGPPPRKPGPRYAISSHNFQANAAYASDNSASVQFQWNPKTTHWRHLAAGFAGIVDYGFTDHRFNLSALVDFSAHHHSAKETWGDVTIQLAPALHIMPGIGFDVTHPSVFFSGRLMAELGSIGPSSGEWNFALAGFGQMHGLSVSAGGAVMFNWGGFKR